MQRILPPVAFLFSLALMAILHSIAPGPTLIEWPYNLFGTALFVAGLSASIWGARQFARIGTNLRTFDDPHKLVMDGLFRLTRNPMYLGFVLALLGASVMLGTATSFGISVAFIVLTDRWYIRFEEQRMLEVFGAEYESYRRRVRRWI